jgi:hypothetical protein
MWVLAGLIIYLWPWLLGAAAIALLAYWMRSLIGLAQAAAAERRAYRAAIIARADQQHNWVMAGDPRGTFGEGAMSQPGARRLG